MIKLIKPIKPGYLPNMKRILKPSTLLMATAVKYDSITELEESNWKTDPEFK